MMLDLLPRSQHPNLHHEKNHWVNELVQTAPAGHPQAHFLDAGPSFLHSDSTISHQDMYKYVHPSHLVYTPGLYTQVYTLVYTPEHRLLSHRNSQVLYRICWALHSLLHVCWPKSRTTVPPCQRLQSKHPPSPT